MSTRYLAIALLPLLIAGTACSRNGQDADKEKPASSADEAKNDGNDKEKKGEKENEPEAVPVEVAEAQIGDISSYLLFNSTLETEGAVEIYPEIAGFVRELLVEEGDRVEAGDILLRLNDDELRIEAREAEVDLSHLESTFSRTEDLAERGMINEQDFESSRFELAQARLRLESANLRLDHTLVRAPVTGVITERAVQIGARVGSSAKLFGMMRLDEMIARVYVPGRYLSSVRVDQIAVLTSDFLPDVSLEGWIKRISPVVDPKSGTFKVTVGVTALADQAPPGLFVAVRIITDTRHDTVLLPKEAVVYEGGERFIFLVEAGKASKKRLDAGFENATQIEAVSEVEPNAPVIVLGQNGLKDGTLVRVVNGAAPTVTDTEPAGDKPGDA